MRFCSSSLRQATLFLFIVSFATGLTLPLQATGVDDEQRTRHSPPDTRAAGYGIPAKTPSRIARDARPTPAPVLTSLVIRATSRDAKIIGSGVGGARITVRNAETGEVLARGIQTGGTGETDLIIDTPHSRDGTIFDTEGAASFLATMSLDEPTLVTIEAEGPLGFPQAMGRATKTMLVVPGQDVRGEGVILEIHGFIVEILQAELRPGETTGEQLYVRVRLRMT